MKRLLGLVIAALLTLQALVFLSIGEEADTQPEAAQVGIDETVPGVPDETAEENHDEDQPVQTTAADLTQPEIGIKLYFEYEGEGVSAGDKLRFRVELKNTGELKAAAYIWQYTNDRPVTEETVWLDYANTNENVLDITVNEVNTGYNWRVCVRFTSNEMVFGREFSFRSLLLKETEQAARKDETEPSEGDADISGTADLEEKNETSGTEAELNEAGDPADTDIGSENDEADVYVQGTETEAESADTDMPETDETDNNEAEAEDDAEVSETDEAEDDTEVSETDETEDDTGASATDDEAETADESADELEQETGNNDETDEEGSETPEAGETADDAPAEKKITLLSSRGNVVSDGEKIFLSCKLEGFDDVQELMLQWECDKGEGFEAVEGATGTELTFIADADSLGWKWRLRVYYR